MPQHHGWSHIVPSFIQCAYEHRGHQFDDEDGGGNCLQENYIGVLRFLSKFT